MNNYTSVTFTWEGEQQPGLWCPALSSNVIPMERSGDGWSFTAELPNASGVSWAIVPNVTEVTARASRRRPFHTKSDGAELVSADRDGSDDARRAEYFGAAAA